MAFALLSSLDINTVSDPSVIRMLNPTTRRYASMYRVGGSKSQAIGALWRDVGETEATDISGVTSVLLEVLFILTCTPAVVISINRWNTWAQRPVRADA